MRFILLSITLGLAAACNSDAPTGQRAPNAAAERYVPPPKPLKPELTDYSGFPAEVEGCRCAFAADSTKLAAQEYLLVYNPRQQAVVSINGQKLKLPLQKAYNDTHHRFGNDTLQLEVRYQAGKPLNQVPYQTTGQALLEARGRVLETYSLVGRCGC